jgi:hypothetical protein
LDDIEYRNPRQLSGPPDEPEEELPSPDLEAELDVVQRLLSLTYEEGWPVFVGTLTVQLQSVVDSMVWGPPDEFQELRGKAQTLRAILDLPATWQAQHATLSQALRSTGSNPEPQQEGE